MLFRSGFAHVWKDKVVLGTISLDMCAVFLGGAGALFPVFARDILQTGVLELLQGTLAIGRAVEALDVDPLTIGHLPLECPRQRADTAGCERSSDRLYLRVFGKRADAVTLRRRCLPRGEQSGGLVS